MTYFSINLVPDILFTVLSLHVVEELFLTDLCTVNLEA
jgi:hypothetical protein